MDFRFQLGVRVLARYSPAMFFRVTVIFILAFFSPPGRAVELPEVVVYGEELGQDSVSQSRINQKNYQHRSVNISEVLARQTGIHVTRFGGLEDATSLSIRGSSTAEVLVLLDGIPLNLAQTGQATSIPLLLEELEHIDIYRSYRPADLGFASSGGVLSLTSKKFSREPQTLASFSTGSFSTTKAHLSHSQSIKNWRVLGALSFTHTEGDFSFEDDNGTPLNPADDTKTSRQNNEARVVHPHLKLRYQWNKTKYLEWGSHYIRKDQGVPGLSSNQSQDADLAHAEWLTGLGFRKDDWKTQSFLRFVKSQFTDLGSEIGLGGAQDNDDQTLLAGQKIVKEWALGKHHLFSTTGDYQWERFQPENYLATPSQGSASQRHHWSFTVADEVRFIDEKLLIHPGLSVDNYYNRLTNDDPSFLTPRGFRNSQTEHELTGQILMAYQMTPGLNISASFNRGFRVPTFEELFGDRGGVVGNSLLNPQTSYQGDFGVKGIVKKLNWRASFFDRRIHDLIQFEQNQGFVRAENIGRARIWGIEAQAQVEFFQFRTSLNYTFQNAKDEATNRGRFLPGRPAHEFHAMLDYPWKRWDFFGDISWMDDNFLDPLNTRVVQDRFLLGSGLSYALGPRTHLSLEVKNLTDNHLVDFVGFPLPGRSVFGRIDWKL